MTGRRSRLTARRRKLRFVAGLAGSFFVCAVVWPALVVLASTAVLGWRPLVLHSGSMAPLLDEGDVLLMEPPGDRIRPGNVIVFRDPDGRGLLTHRTVGRNDDGTYRTKGDANRTEDNLGVAPEDIVGRGRLLVPWLGRPLVWLQAGSWVSVAAAALAFAASLRVAKYGVLRHYDPWAPPAYSVYRDDQWVLVDQGARWRRLGTPLGSAAAATVVVCLVLGSGAPPRASLAAFSAASTNGSDSWAARPFFPRFLKTDLPGDRPSTAYLPLNTGRPTVATLPNYDTDLDGSPGRSIARGGSGPDEDNPRRTQTWYETMPSAFTVNGTARLRFWSAMQDFNTTAGAVTAYLMGCPTTVSCTTLGSASISGANWSGGSTTWVEKVIEFGAVNYTVPAEGYLVVKIIVPMTADEKMWFAYDTTAYPSRLTVD